MLWEAPLLVGRSTRTEGELQEAQRSTKQPVFGRQDRESHTQMVPATALDAPAWDSTTGASGAGCWNTCLGDRWHHREHASRVWERTAVSCVETAWKGWGWSIARLQLGMFPEAQAGHAERSHVLSSQKGGAGPHFQPFSPHTGPAPSGSRELRVARWLNTVHCTPQGTAAQPPAGFSAQRRDLNHSPLLGSMSA